jgi:hypothetical protein
MSYIDDEELKINIDEEDEEGGDVEVKDPDDDLNDPIIDDDLLEDDEPLSEEFSDGSNSEY